MISANDIFIVFSHRGTKTFSIQSLDIAKKWSFGLEQFLHGPRATLDKQSSLVAFTSMIEPRKDSLIKYAETIGAEVVEINEKTFNGVSKEFTWLAQLLYGQQLALELSKRLATNPPEYVNHRRIINVLNEMMSKKPPNMIVVFLLLLPSQPSFI